MTENSKNALKSTQVQNSTRSVEKPEKSSDKAIASNNAEQAKELGGPKGLEPTRYGDWESKGRCYDF